MNPCIVPRPEKKHYTSKPRNEAGNDQKATKPCNEARNDQKATKPCNEAGNDQKASLGQKRIRDGNSTPPPNKASPCVNNEIPTPSPKEARRGRNESNSSEISEQLQIQDGHDQKLINTYVADNDHTHPLGCKLEVESLKRDKEVAEAEAAACRVQLVAYTEQLVTIKRLIKRTLSEGSSGGKRKHILEGNEEGNINGGPNKKRKMDTELIEDEQ